MCLQLQDNYCPSFDVDINYLEHLLYTAAAAAAAATTEQRILIYFYIGLSIWVIWNTPQKQHHGYVQEKDNYYREIKKKQFNNM